MVRIAVLAFSILGLSAVHADERFITLASATSAQDSGLLDYIVPIFRAATGVGVHVEAVGSGQALAMGANGKADALLLQDSVGQRRFVANGYGIDGQEVMRNDFVIVGPRSDPAGIRGLADALTAFALVAAKGALFASRGDDGGTYIMERRLWQSAAINPEGKAWYRKLDAGVGTTLTFAAGVDAYTLADRATWANLKNRQNLEILAQGDPLLSNVYGSVLVNPDKWPTVKFHDAATWHAWLTSRAGLDAIRSYRIDGEEIFFSPRLPL